VIETRLVVVYNIGRTTLKDTLMKVDVYTSPT
jgi:hypothetical protein